MPDDPQILDYAATEIPSHKATFVESPDGFTLTLPVVTPLQRFALLFPVGFSALFGIVLVGHEAAQLYADMGALWLLAEIWSEAPLLMLTSFSFVLICWLGFIYWALWLWRFRHTSPVFRVADGRLSWQCPGLWNLRRQEWPLNDIRDVRLKVEKFLSKSSVVLLRIRFHHSRTLNVRFLGDDPEPARRAEARLNELIAAATDATPPA